MPSNKEIKSMNSLENCYRKLQKKIAKEQLQFEIWTTEEKN